MLIICGYCYRLYPCLKHISLRKEKERKVTGFWYDPELKPGKEYCRDADAKAALDLRSNPSPKPEQVMLKKKNRANRRSVEKIFKLGRSVGSLSLRFKFILSGEKFSPRISFVVPKKLAKGAVARNLLRRHGYAALPKRLDKFPLGLIGVFIFNKKEKSVRNLEDEIKTILNKVH